MIAANTPVQRPNDAKLLAIGPGGVLKQLPRAVWVTVLRPGDLVIANDAAVLPASLHGIHERTGASIEVRLAGRESLATEEVGRFWAIVFGAGDYHTRTEDRPAPPVLATGDQVRLGMLLGTVEPVPAHPRLVSLTFEGSPAAIWAGLAAHGRPIQYAHVPQPLALWDVWTPIAGPPAAYESPSAGFVLDWAGLARLRERGVGFATLTHAAGISSTGDLALDRWLPFDEPYRISETTAQAIRDTRARGGRIVAIGTTVVRALEHAAAEAGDELVRSGDGIATNVIGPHTRLRVVDALLTGTHDVDTSHYQLLRAFAGDALLAQAAAALESGAYRTHEFGDSVFVEAQRQVAVEDASCWGSRAGPDATLWDRHEGVASGSEML
jgi:S-adenosylmethionine:tRNA ribosyltransferase-isomerase